MRNRQTLFLLIGLLVAIIAAGLALRSAQHVQDPDSGFDGAFAFPAEDIDRIRLTKGRGDVIELHRTADGWKVNGKYRARMSSVSPLLEALSLMKIKYIPSEKATEHIRWEIAAHGIGVELFDKGGAIVRHYIVGGATYNEMGTHVMMQNSRQPYVMYLPTMDGSFRTRFALSEEDWRDRHFVSIDQNEITAVDVLYPGQRSQSFVVRVQDGSYEVRPLFPGMRNYGDRQLPGRAEAFLRSLADLACESYKNAYPGIDSIRGLTPFSSITVTTKDTARAFSMNVYPNGIPVYSEFTGPVHRLFIDVIPGDFVGAQYQVVKGILRGVDHFFEGEEEIELIF